VITNPIEVVDGYIDPPTRPGLGIDVDEQAAAKYPFQPEAMQRYFHPDGSVADW
jgi:galactonate dehydratase